MDPFDIVDKYEKEPKMIGFRSKKIGVNENCPCGSKKKFKKCCFNKESTDGYYTKNCKFCNCTIRSLDHHGYLNHVETDRASLMRSLNSLEKQSIDKSKNEWIASDKPIRSDKDLEYNFEMSQELKTEINKRIHLLNDLNRYLYEQRKDYPLPDI